VAMLYVHNLLKGLQKISDLDFDSGSVFVAKAKDNARREH